MASEPSKGWAPTVWAMLHEGDDAIPVLVFETAGERNRAAERMRQHRWPILGAGVWPLPPRARRCSRYQREDEARAEIEQLKVELADRDAAIKLLRENWPPGIIE